MDQDVLLAYINDENATECLRLSCWDFGGQDSFYGLHHLYIGAVITVYSRQIHVVDYADDFTRKSLSVRALGLANWGFRT